MTSITTIADLVHYCAEGLECAGVEDIDRAALEDSIRAHRVVRYEDHGEEELAVLFRAVWDDMTDGAEWPYDEPAILD